MDTTTISYGVCRPEISMPSRTERRRNPSLNPSTYASRQSLFGLLCSDPRTGFCVPDQEVGMGHGASNHVSVNIETEYCISDQECSF